MEHDCYYPNFVGVRPMARPANWHFISCNVGNIVNSCDRRKRCRNTVVIDWVSPFCLCGPGLTQRGRQQIISTDRLFPPSAKLQIWHQSKTASKFSTLLLRECRQPTLPTSILSLSAPSTLPSPLQSPPPSGSIHFESCLTMRFASHASSCGTSAQGTFRNIIDWLRLPF